MPSFESLSPCYRVKFNNELQELGVTPTKKEDMLGFVWK